MRLKHEFLQQDSYLDFKELFWLLLLGLLGCSGDGISELSTSALAHKGVEQSPAL